MSDMDTETVRDQSVEVRDQDPEEESNKDTPAPTAAGGSTTTKVKRNTKKKNQGKAKEVNSSKKRKVEEDENDDDTNEEDSPTELKKKLKFYMEKADVTEDRMLLRGRQLDEERAKHSAEQKKKKEEIQRLKEEVKRAKESRKGKKKEKLEVESSEEESSEPQSSSEESEPSRPARRKTYRIPKVEITAADRRAARVCAYEPCDRLPDCTFVHIPTAEMRRAKAAKSRGRKGERAGQDLDLARLVGAALLGNMKKNSK